VAPAPLRLVASGTAVTVAVAVVVAVVVAVTVVGLEGTVAVVVAVTVAGLTGVVEAVVVQLVTNKTINIKQAVKEANHLIFLFNAIFGLHPPVYILVSSARLYYYQNNRPGLREV